MDLLPVRGPLFHDQITGAVPPESADRPDKYDDLIRQWKNAADMEANAVLNLNEEMANLERYARHIRGDHWPKNRPKYKSQFVLNLIGRSRTAGLAQLTDAQPNIAVFCNSVRGQTQDNPYQDSANLIHNVLQAEWLNTRAPLMLYFAGDVAYATGTAFWKIGSWAPGYTKLVPLGPDAVTPIQPGLHLQDSTAVRYRTFKSIPWLRKKFGRKRTEGLERYSIDPWRGFENQPQYNRPSHIPDSVWNGMNPGFQKILGVPAADPRAIGESQYFNVVEWNEYYVDDRSVNETGRDIVMRDPYLPLDAHNWWYVVKPGERLYPGKRLIVFAGDRPMYDGPQLDWHGMYPFSVLRFNPVFYSFWGLGRYRDQIPINTSINSIIAGVLDLVKMALNRQVVAKEGSVSPAAWNMWFSDVPGAKYLLQGTSANPASDIKYMDIPQLPGFVFQMLAALIPQFSKQAGELDVAELWQKEQVPGGDTIERMRDALGAQGRLEDKMLHWFLQDAGTLAVSNVIQYYTMRRRMQMLGTDGTTMQDFDVDPHTLVPGDLQLPEKREFWKNFGIRVAPGSTHSGSQDRRKQIGIQMTAMGLYPVLDLYRDLEIPDPQGTFDRLKQQYASGVMPGGARTPRTSRGQRNGGM